MDECTSNSSKRVFSILGSYFEEVKGKSAVKHYESTDCIVVNAETLFNKIARLFSKDNITWDNLVLHILDSTNYMCGKKSGLENRLREKAPQLLDINGDMIAITLLKNFVVTLIIP